MRNGQPAPNESFWLDAIETEELEPYLEGNREADVVLVGGGYTNLVAAYCLKRERPDLEIALLESSYVGFGASGRNAGMVLQDPHVELMARHGERAIRFTYDETVGVVDWIERVAREEGFDCELEKTGYFEVAFHPRHVHRIEQLATRARKVGIELPLLSRDEIRERIRSQRFIGALRHPGAAMLHPGKYVTGLKRAVLRAGVHVYEQTRVTELDDSRRGGEVRVATERGSLLARKVVLGLNAYLPAARLGVIQDRAVSLLSFIILTEPLSDGLWKELSWRGREGYSDLRRIHNYVRPAGRRILFGGRVLYHFGVDSPAESERIYSRLQRELVATFPCLEGVTLTHRWSGPVALTWRRAPIIGRTGRANNIFYALGYSGMGVSLGTLSGRVLADWIVGQESRWKELLYLAGPGWPLPPEPFRFLGFQGSYHAMRLRDWLDRFS